MGKEDGRLLLWDLLLDRRCSSCWRCYFGSCRYRQSCFLLLLGTETAPDPAAEAEGTASCKEEEAADADAILVDLRCHCRCCCHCHSCWCCLSLKLNLKLEAEREPDQHLKLVPSLTLKLVRQLERTRPTILCQRALLQLKLQLEQRWLLREVPQQWYSSSCSSSSSRPCQDCR